MYLHCQRIRVGPDVSFFVLHVLYSVVAVSFWHLCMCDQQVLLGVGMVFFVTDVDLYDICCIIVQFSHTSHMHIM